LYLLIIEKMSLDSVLAFPSLYRDTWHTSHCCQGPALFLCP
jgi:hypothetical protein